MTDLAALTARNAARRKTNQNGIDLIKRWEGCFLKAYQGAADRRGLLTIGYGHTDAAGPPKVTAGLTITAQEAENILRTDLAKVEASVERLVKVPLTDNQFAVLVSFAFNLGDGNLKSSSLLRRLNAGDYAAVPSELMKWVNANGKRVQGLVNRRQDEAALWQRAEQAPVSPPPSVASKPSAPPVMPSTPPAPSPAPQTLIDKLLAALAAIFTRSRS